MPHFIERLDDVEEDSCTQSSFLKALHYFVDNAMCLLDKGVAGVKPELVTRNEEGEVHIRPEALQEESLEDLRREGRRIIGRKDVKSWAVLPGFGTFIICANFHISG